MKAVEEMVYTNWDNSDSAPPKARPTEPMADPTLSLLTWDGSAARFPDSVLSKFAAGTAAHHEVQTMNAQLIQEFPESGGNRAGLGQGQQNRTRPRATGRWQDAFGCDKVAGFAPCASRWFLGHQETGSDKAVF